MKHSKNFHTLRISKDDIFKKSKKPIKKYVNEALIVSDKFWINIEQNIFVIFIRFRFLLKAFFFCKYWTESSKYITNRTIRKIILISSLTYKIEFMNFKISDEFGFFLNCFLHFKLIYHQNKLYFDSRKWFEWLSRIFFYNF